jgi:HD-GYP domain-containing protein (c-di-GMP phosphodiesterase class II)
VLCRLAARLVAPVEVRREVFFVALLQHVGCVAHAHDSMALDGGRTVEVNAAADVTDFSHPADVVKSFLPELRGGGDLPRRLLLLLPAKRMGAVLNRTSCEVAEATARRIGLPQGVQVGLRHINEWYNGKGGYLGRKGDDIPLAARIVLAAFDASIFDTVAGVDAAVDAARARSGRRLDPAVAAAFVRDGAEILAELHATDVLAELPALEPDPKVSADADRIDDIAVAFGEAVDLKTPATHGAAPRAFELAGAAATALGLDAPQVREVRRAAALRDIGKAALDNVILERPGPLTQADWEQVRLHGYHSERVLSRSPALAAEAHLAGLHHERADGSGYHRGAGAEALSLAAQVIAATDALIGMSQSRPDRPALDLEAASTQLNDEARRGWLHTDAVRAVTAVAHGATQKVRRSNPAGLSDRQIEVLRLVAQGLSNRQIAEQLVVSPRTAEHHVQDIYTKIGVASRAAVALFATEHQLLN